MTTATSGTVVFNVIAANTAPSWWANDTTFPVGTWTTIAGTGTLDAVKPSPAVSGASGMRSVVDKWTGGCVDQSRRALILAANGGHADYSGNEVYELQVGAATPAWVRLTNPSTESSGGGSFGVSSYADGRIRSLHSRNVPQFVDGKVWLMWCDGMWLTGGYTPCIWSFDRDSLGNGPFPVANAPWQMYSGSGPNGAMWSSSGNQNFEGPCATYDPVGGRLWLIGGSGALSNQASLFSCLPSSPVSSYVQHTVGSFADPGISGSWAVVATQTTPRVLLHGGRSGILTALDISSNNPTTRYQVATSGSPTGLTKDAGAVYVPGANCVLVYHQSYGASIRKLSIPANPITGTYTWSTITPGGSNPATGIAGDYEGPYSKFNIIDDMGDGRSALVVVQGVTRPTYVYKGLESL